MRKCHKICQKLDFCFKSGGATSGRLLTNITPKEAMIEANARFQEAAKKNFKTMGTLGQWIDTSPSPTVEEDDHAREVGDEADLGTSKHQNHLAFLLRRT